MSHITNLIPKPLSAQDFARLQIKFVVPVVIPDMLCGEEILDDVAEYSLHDMMGSLEADGALLCLALCAQHMASAHSGIAIAHILGAEATRIIDDYAPSWVAHDEGAILNDAHIKDMLLNVPEELEALSDLFFATGAEMDEANAVSAILCDILGEQSQMHMFGAEEKLSELGLIDRDDLMGDMFTPPRLTAQPAPPRAAVHLDSNIVLFPRSTR